MADLLAPASSFIVREGWILAGILDGGVAYPRLGDDVCGIPHALRLACDLALAGTTSRSPRSCSFAAGALTFFVVFFVQLARNLTRDLRAFSARRPRTPTARRLTS